MSSKLKILYAAAEVVPFAKTGGLADVAGALPGARHGRWLRQGNRRHQGQD